MANIWRNIAGRLGDRLGVRSCSSMSRVADRASDPAPYKLTFFQGICVTVCSCSAAIALLIYRSRLERTSADERRALAKGLERTGGKVSVAFDKELERTEQAPEVLKFIEWKFEREFLEWKARQPGAQIVPRETKMKAEQLARARKD